MSFWIFIGDYFFSIQCSNTLNLYITLLTFLTIGVAFSSLRTRYYIIACYGSTHTVKNSLWTQNYSVYKNLMLLAYTHVKKGCVLEGKEIWLWIIRHWAQAVVDQIQILHRFSLLSLFLCTGTYSKENCYVISWQYLWKINLYKQEEKIFGPVLFWHTLTQSWKKKRMPEIRAIRAHFKTNCQFNTKEVLTCTLWAPFIVTPSCTISRTGKNKFYHETLDL